MWRILRSPNHPPKGTELQAERTSYEKPGVLIPATINTLLSSIEELQLQQGNGIITGFILGTERIRNIKIKKVTSKGEIIE